MAFNRKVPHYVGFPVTGGGASTNSAHAYEGLPRAFTVRESASLKGPLSGSGAGTKARGRLGAMPPLESPFQSCLLWAAAS